MNNIKKITQKDRYGAMTSYEFNVPSLNEVPKPEGDHPGDPRGTDTVPAWLTPGENVVNAEASRLPGNQQMIDQMNDQGRAIQKQQGGPIPSYEADGGQIPMYSAAGDFVNENLLDRMSKVESNDDPNAVSGVGAGGQYQIMPATAAQPGYGVNPISDADRFDPVKSRQFAKEYLVGIAQENPDFTEDEVITAYHSGAGNVRKAKNNVESLGVNGQEYAGKVNAAMEDPNNLFGVNKRKVGTVDPNNDGVPEITYDERAIEPGMFSAMASTNDSTKIVPSVEGSSIVPPTPREVQQDELGVDDSIIIDSGGSVQAVNPNRVTKDIPQKLAEQFAEDGNKERYDRRLNEYKQALKQDKANKDFLENKNKDINLNKNKEISNQVSQIDSQIEKAKADGDDTLAQVLTKKKENLEKEKVEIKTTEDKIKTVKKIVQDTNDANYGEGDQIIDKADKQWAKDNLTGEFEGDFAQNLINKAQGLGGEALDSVSGWFKESFQQMFNGPELARMAMVYAGARVLGYDHGGSLNYSMKNYLKRVDSNLASAKAFSLTDKARDDYTEASLKEYAKTGDRNKLMPKTGKLAMKQTSGSAYLRGVGKVQKYKDANGVEYISYKGKSVPVSSLLGYIEPWDESVQGDKAVSGEYSKFAEEATKVANSNYNLSKGTKNKETYDTTIKTNSIKIGKEANRVYRDLIRKNHLSVNDTINMQSSINTAIENYVEDLAKWESGGKKKGEKPNGVEGYIDELVRIPLTGVETSLFSGTSTANLNALDDKIRGEMDIRDPRNPNFKKEYKEDWMANQNSWIAIPKEEKSKWIKRAADKKNFSGFTLWASRTSAEEKAKFL